MAADYSVYMLRCSDNSLYTGIALDVEKRLQEHRSGARGAKYVRGRQPLTLVFQRVAGDRAEASRCEHLIKKLPRAEKERLISGQLEFSELVSSAESVVGA